jgi:transposase-like protein
MTKRKQFSAAFKREAVRLLDTSRKQPSDLARELGVRRNQLYKWKDQLSRRGKQAFPGQGRRLESSDKAAQGRVFTFDISRLNDSQSHEGYFILTQP